MHTIKAVYKISIDYFLCYAVCENAFTLDGNIGIILVIYNAIMMGCETFRRGILQTHEVRRAHSNDVLLDRKKKILYSQLYSNQSSKIMIIFSSVERLREITCEKFDH